MEFGDDKEGFFISIPKNYFTSIPMANKPINSKKYSNSEVSVRGRAAPQVITMTLNTIYSVVFLTNLVTACKKAENPFEKRIPHFRLDTENFGDRDFYDCTELHKARMDP